VENGTSTFRRIAIRIFVSAERRDARSLVRIPRVLSSGEDVLFCLEIARTNSKDCMRMAKSLSLSLSLSALSFSFGIPLKHHVRSHCREDNVTEISTDEKTVIPVHVV